MNLSRLEALVTSEGIEKIKKLKVLVLGLGGVGGYVVESLTRCGVENITLVDGDIIKPSNINRQLVVTSKNNNKYKTREWKKRIKSINKNAVVNIINMYLTEENISSIFSNDYTYDYIVDACDTTKVKVSLIKECHERGIKLISSMGTANKLDATKLRITTLDKTDTDPKKIRKEFSRKKEIMKDVTVVVSDEKPINTKMLGSSPFVPGVAGLYITNYIIKDVVDSLN